MDYFLDYKSLFYFRKLKAKFESESSELESENEVLRAKVHSVREKCSKLEEENLVSRATIKQREIDILEMKKVKKRM